MSKQHSEAIASPKELSEVLTVPETAKLLRLSIGTIRAWVLAKKIPYCKFGGRVRFRRCDLDEFMQRSKVPAQVGA